MIAGNSSLSNVSFFCIAAQGLERKTALLCGYNLQSGASFIGEVNVFHEEEDFAVIL